MPQSDKLTDTAIRRAKPARRDQKLADGGGLYLLVTPSGARYWRLKYRVDGREKKLALGVYPAVSLKAARLARAKAKAQMHEGKDPGAVRQHAKIARRHAAANTFEAVAREWYAKKSPKWAASNALVILGRLEKDAFPHIGSTPIGALSNAELLATLLRVEDRGAVESAHRLRQYINSVFLYAMQTHRVIGNPTPDPGALASPVKGRFPSITEPRAVGALMRAIRGYHGSVPVRCALQLAPLLFVRPGELRTAEWSELDLDAAEWRIPADKMKMRAPHFVPLSAQAVALFREVHAVTGTGRYVFPSERSRARPMSANTLNAALRALGFTKEQMTTHGFRHMASTLLNESGKWRADAIERQLAHADNDSIRAVYNTAEYLPERKQMMQWWSDRLDTLATSDNVVGLKARA